MTYQLNCPLLVNSVSFLFSLLRIVNIIPQMDPFLFKEKTPKFSETSVGYTSTMKYRLAEPRVTVSPLYGDLVL